MRPDSRLRSLIALAAAGFAFAASPARAQSKTPADFNRLLATATFNNGSGYGARALGMAGAFSAIADDASAASWNPAGLGQLFKTEVMVAGSYAKAKIDFNGETTFCSRCFYRQTENFTVDADATGLDFVSLVVPFKIGKQSVTAQASYTRNVRPLDANFSYRLNFFNQPGGTDLGPDLFDTSYDASGGYDSAGLAFASSIGDKLYIGTSLNWWFGGTTLDITEKYVSKGTGNVTLIDSTQTRHDSLDVSGLSANVGLLFKPSDKVSLGLVYRGGFSGTEKEASTFRSTGVFRNNQGQMVPFTNASSVEFDSTLNWPATIGGGIAVRPVDVFTIAFDGSYTFWSDSYLNRLVTACGDADGCFNDFVRFPSLSARFPEQNDQTALRVGLEYVLRPGSITLPVRAGAYRVRTIAPFYSVGDTEPGTWFTGFSAGLGLAIPAGNVNVIFDVGATFDRASSTAGNYVGTFQNTDGSTTDLPVTQTGERKVANTRVVSSLIVRF